MEFYTQRIKRLQSLCTSAGTNALVFIPGPDGRHNKGSMSLLKYIFQGSVGKDIYDGVLDDKSDCLEEVILIIQEHTVSIFWGSTAKSIGFPSLSGVQGLVEYIPTPAEVENVDLYELRKCKDFKRMVLESIPEGGVVGIPVPFGYDDVLDIESWPLIQAFANDTVLFPTGFFTERYAVVDITDSLDVIFQTVDGFYLEKAIDVIERNILPQHQQCLSVLQTSYGETKKCLTADDIIAPLEMLFEFGEIDSVYPVDPQVRPQLYMNYHSDYPFGEFDPLSRWKKETVRDNSSVIIEGTEPSTGMRWCRTYFLQRGKFVNLIRDPDALVSSEVTASSVSAARTDVHDDEHLKAIATLEYLYFKAWVALRWAVRTAFSVCHDVLDAGDAVQKYLHDILHSNGSANCSHCTDVVDGYFNGNIRVHMDCMNAIGQVVKIEDVDDMGGQCWTYIRVTLDALNGPGSSKAIVAFGDTFLFTPCVSNLLSSDAPQSLSCREMLLNAHVHDAYCVTHSIPQYNSMLSHGTEENMGRRMVAYAKSMHTSHPFSLGSSIGHDAGLLELILLTDHHISPVVVANARMFENGFAVERIDSSFSPFIVVMGLHVSNVWTLDTKECLSHARSLLPSDEQPRQGILSTCEEGLVVILKLKSTEELEANPGVQTGIECNMAESVLSSSFSCGHIAFVVPSSSRYAKTFTEAYRSWGNSIRQYDIPHIRGFSDTHCSPPSAVLLSFIVACDRQHTIDSDSEKVYIHDAVVGDNIRSRVSTTPGSGYLALRENIIQKEGLQQAGDLSSVTRKAVVVAGHSGSGVLNLAAQVYERLNGEDGIDTSQCTVSDIVVVELSSDEVKSVLDNAIQKISSKSKSRCVVFAVIASTIDQPLDDVKCYFCQHDIQVVASIAVLSVDALQYPAERNDNFCDFGRESWIAGAKAAVNFGTVSTLSFVVLMETAKNDEYRGYSVDSDIFLMLKTAGSNATTVKVRPNSMWLDSEIISSILDSVHGLKGASCHRSKSSEDILFRKNQVYQSPGRNLSDITVKVEAWDLPGLCAVLRKLFPSALFSNTCTNNDWVVPRSTGSLSGIQLSFLLAKIKVFSSRQKQVSYSKVMDTVSSLESAKREAISCGLLSCHAIIEIPNDSAPQHAFIEACAGSIIVRPVGSVPVGRKNILSVTGCFTDDEVEFVRCLFSSCRVHELEFKQPVTRKDIDPSSYAQIEKRFSNMPVPSGWWFDGSVYVDMHGTRLPHRPDMANLLEAHAAEMNSEIVKYNDMLADVKPYL